MSSAEHLDNGSIEPVAESQPPILLDAEEPVLNHISPEVHDFGSLLSLNTRKRKKTPVITLDPAEAEAAARQFQIIAAQDFANADKSARDDVLAGFSALHATGQEAAFAHAGADWEPGILEDLAHLSEPVDLEAQTPESELPLPDAAAFADLWAGAWTEDQANDCVMPAGRAEFEDSIAADEAGGIETFPEPAETGPSECAPSPLPNRCSHGHSLRTQFVQILRPRTTPADQILVLLRRLHAWVKRSWATMTGP